MILKYTVQHAQPVATQREVEVDGQSGTFTVNKIVVELVPVNDDGTIKLELPLGSDVVAEGTVIDVDFGGLLNG